MGKVIGNIHFLRTAITCLLSASLTLCSCERLESPVDVPYGDECPGAFSILADDFGLETKSRLSGSSFSETKVSSVQLVAYYNGKRVRSQRYTSGLTAMSFSLPKNRTYNVYALVNWNVEETFPVNESQLAQSFSLECVPYLYMNSNGLPMAGSKSVTIGTSASGTISIPVKRLFAKVNLDMMCNWSGAKIVSARVKNMTIMLNPYGTCSRDSASTNDDAWYDLTSGGTSPEMTTVMYVPENIQGSIFNNPEWENDWQNGTISSSRMKTFDTLPQEVQDRLTYLEVEVTSTGQYSGTRRYRFILGNDKFNNCDIVRNCVYDWSIVMSERYLWIDEWRSEGDGWSDNRYINANTVFVERISTTPWSDIYATNVASDYLSRELRVPSGVSYTLNDLNPSQSASALTVNSPASFRTLFVDVVPYMNPLDLPTYATVNLIEKEIWFDTDTYVVDPGGSVTAYVSYGYYWPMRDSDCWNPIYGKGSGSSKEWEYTSVPATNMTSTYTAGSGSTPDKIVYSVPLTVAPGTYGISASRVSSAPVPADDYAEIIVNDTRYLRWQDCSSNVTISQTSNYAYLSYNYTEGVFSATARRGANVTKSGQNWYNTNYYQFGDVSGSSRLQNKYISTSSLGTYFDLYVSEDGGSTWVNSTNISQCTYFAFSTSIGWGSSSIWFQWKQDLPVGTYGVKLCFKDGSHPIYAWLNVVDDVSEYEYELEIEPASSSSNRYNLEKGYSKQLVANLYVYEDGSPYDDHTVTPLCTWVSSNTSIATVTANGKVIALSAGNAQITASYSTDAGVVTDTFYLTVLDSSGGGVGDGWD